MTTSVAVFAVAGAALVASCAGYIVLAALGAKRRTWEWTGPIDEKGEGQ